MNGKKKTAKKKTKKTVGPWLMVRDGGLVEILTPSGDVEKLSPKDSWDCIVALRGPDDENGVAKTKFTEKYRGMYIKYHVTEDGYTGIKDDSSAISRAGDGSGFCFSPPTKRTGKTNLSTVLKSGSKSVDYADEIMFRFTGAVCTQSHQNCCCGEHIQIEAISKESHFVKHALKVLMIMIKYGWTDWPLEKIDIG